MALNQIGQHRPPASMHLSERHYPTTMRCMNPECTAVCTHKPHRRGRSEFFCCSYCRQRYGHWRRRLLTEQLLLISALSSTEVHGAELVTLRQQLSHLEWVLTRYPNIGSAAKNRANGL